MRLRLEESDARHRGTRGSEGSSIQFAPEGATEAVQVQSRDFAQPVRATRGVRLRDPCRGRLIAAQRRPRVPLAGRRPRLLHPWLQPGAPHGAKGIARGAWAIDIAPSRLNRDASAIKLDYTRIAPGDPIPGRRASEDESFPTFRLRLRFRLVAHTCADAPARKNRPADPPRCLSESLNGALEPVARPARRPAQKRIVRSFHDFLSIMLSSLMSSA